MALASKQVIRQTAFHGPRTQMVRLASNKVHLRQIDSNLQILHKEGNPQNPRPLVLLYAWMAAKGRHKKKYADFYLNKGFDVLHVSLKPSQLMVPKKAQEVSSKLLDLLMEDKNLQDKDLAVHTFSVGAYFYSESLVKISKQPEIYEPVSSRIRGQIFDSPVGVVGIPEGLPKAFTKNPLIVNLSRKTLEWYMDKFRDEVTKHYELAEEKVLENENKVPNLFLYSEADPVGQAKNIERFIERLERNSSVFSKCWPDSPHVSHMLYHPHEYISMVNEFLDHIGLGRVFGEREDDRIEMEGDGARIHTQFHEEATSLFRLHRRPGQISPRPWQYVGESAVRQWL